MSNMNDMCYCLVMDQSCRNKNKIGFNSELKIKTDNGGYKYKVF